ncbi:MAG: epoxyqueuosine reductase [Thermodesulfobacteriota bacterium]
MPKEEKVVLLTNPNRVLEQLVKNFIKDNEKNRRTQLDQGVYWEEPLVGFASGLDPLFFEYKTMIGPFHFTPREIISAAFKEKGRSLLLTEIEQISVISWILPASEDTRRSNRREDRFPSKLWAYTRDFGEACNDALRRHVVDFLENLGYVAVAPVLLPTFQYIRDEKVGWASPWSERHIAYACGLGTFSLTDGFITPKGIAIRIGSVVTLLKLAPSEKKYRHHRENCLFFRNEECGKCISRCPAGAITEKGHDKDKCREYINSEPLKAKHQEYGLQDPPSACGLCQTAVPCEFEIPRPNLIA